MEGSSNHSCLYYTAEAQQLEIGHPRTLGSLRNVYDRWEANSGGDIKNCKDYRNVKNPPLLQGMPNEVPILKIIPSLVLHIMLGIFNHVWKNMENVSEEHHEFAMRHNCVKGSYWGKTFEGSECVKLMKKKK